MHTFAEIEELKAKRLCAECIGESYLRGEVGRLGKRRVCSYCGERRNTYTAEVVAERIDRAFGQHYVRTSDQPDALQWTMMSDREFDYEFERGGEPVVWAIINAADVPEEAAQDIQVILEDEYEDRHAQEAGEETAYSVDSYYEAAAVTDERWQEEWREFERSLKQETRFFNDVGRAHLGSIFRSLNVLETVAGRSVVVDAGPGTAITGFFRARAFQSQKRLEEAMCRPDLEIGPPPAQFAASGRMNAQGISVFYGADAPAAAIAEVRPPVGSHVVVARFNILRPLKLLDLTALVDIAEGGSIFDEGLADRLAKAAFLRTLTAKITRPVMPDDQAFDYLATQAVADYLATSTEPAIDGILFPSVQIGGSVLNVVLFHKASLVEPIELPADTELEASTGYDYGDGFEQEFAVTEIIPAPAAESTTRQQPNNWPDFGALTFAGWRDPSAEQREATLSVDQASVRVHKVDVVEFRTTEHVVTRRRRERR